MRALFVVLLLFVVALSGCSSTKDSDNDGLPDSAEKAGWEIIVYGMAESTTRRVVSDADAIDSDGDGLSDWDEVFVRAAAGLPRLDPSSPDTDGDGLTDCQEWYVQVGDCPNVEGYRSYEYKAFQTDPSFVDSDFPSHSRYLQYQLHDGLGYLDHEGYQTSNRVYLWGDGLSDFEEIFGYDVTGPDGSVRTNVRSNPALLDTDGDGLEDGEEGLLHGSDPLNPDSDGDGCMDGRDLFPAQADTYRVAFNQIRITDSPGAGSTRLMLVSAIAAADITDFQFHPVSGHETVDDDALTDVSHLNGGFLARSDCDENSPLQVATAYKPWILVQTVAAHKEVGAEEDNREAFQGDHVDSLDFEAVARTGGGEPGAYLYWNPQLDVYRYGLPEDAEAWRLDDDPAAFELPAGGWIHGQGAAGEIWFRPEVHLL